MPFPALSAGLSRALRRGFCGILSLFTVLSCLPRAYALPEDPPTVEDGVRPSYDEAYYATTDYYGNLTEGSVVKSYTLNGAETVTDNGYYDEVVNLTDGSDPERSNGTVTFRFEDAAPSRFYFEGKTAAPFRNLPWHLSIHYALNGVAVRAEDLAGKTGVVEITVDAVPNETASDYAKNNYILACNAIFNQDDILSLEAPGAQLQLIGNLRAALFLALPGEEKQFVMRVGAESFSFGGLTLMLVPATLSQLEEIAKLSEKKSDLEDSYHKLSDSLDTVLDAFHEMQESLYQTADGLDALDKARKTVSDGKDSIYRELDKVQSDLGTIASALDPVAGLADDASRSLTESKDKANTLIDETLGLGEDLERTETNLGTMQEHLLAAEGNLEGLEEDLGNLEGNLEELESLLQRSEETLDDGDSALADLRSQLQGVDQALSRLEGSLGELSGNIDHLQEYQENGETLLDDVSQLRTSLNRLRSALSNVRVPTYSTSGSRSENLEQVVDAGEKLEKLYALTETQAGQEAAFFAAMLQQQGIAAEQAEQLAGLFAANSPEAIAAADPDGTKGLSATYQKLYALYTMETFTDFFQAILVSRGYTEKDAAQAARLWRIYENNDRSLAALELIMDTADDVEGDLGSASSAAAGVLRSLSSPAAQVLENLSSLCGDMDDLRDLLDDADEAADSLRDNLSRLSQLLSALRSASGSLEDGTDVLRDAADLGQDGLELGERVSANVRLTSTDVRDMSAAARDASGTVRELLDIVKGTSVRTREILEDTDALRVTLNGFEPTARNALKQLGDLSDSAAAAVRDANRLADAAKNVTKPAGRQLDQGAKQSLDGLASTLRTAAEGLDTTTDLQSAKDAVTQLIEDTWDEYTGDINNLLLMDAAAEAQSLTSGKNPPPQSVQVLIRTQEIKEEKEDSAAHGSDGSGASGSGGTDGGSGRDSGGTDSGNPGTFLGRVGKMFRDLWNGLTSIFR